MVLSIHHDPILHQIKKNGTGENTKVIHHQQGQHREVQKKTQQELKQTRKRKCSNLWVNSIKHVIYSKDCDVQWCLEADGCSKLQEITNFSL